jgi:tight adherence protein B
MFGFDTTIIAFVGLVTLAVAAIIYFVLFERVASEVKQEKRVKSIGSRVSDSRSSAAARITDAAKRRKNVQESLKELEKNQQLKASKSVGLRKQIQQAGLSMSMQKFALISLVCGLAFTAIAFFAGANFYVAGAAGIVGAAGFPRWMVARMRKRRFDRFLNEFPNAVDVIVRGVKAGLPINDCLAIIAREAKEPVAGEFRRVLEAQQLGVPLSEAISKLYESIPLPEANFFGIVISIQQSAGGNLSEALGNLSNVLRDRKKMKGKIQAMSAEAKASGAIIGALPLIVMLLVYLTTPDYIKILFVDRTGNIVLLCSAVWMSIGIMVMKKMINFDF